MSTFTESVVEEAALSWLESLGYAILHGPDIAPGEPFSERETYGQVVLEQRLRQALQRLNPDAPPGALDEAFRRLTRPDSPSLVANNHAVHRYLVEGVPVEYQRADGSFRGDLIRVLDHENPEDNDFLAVNQFTVVEDRRERRPDVVLFVNGLPLAVIELKNPANERADIGQAFNQGCSVLASLQFVAHCGNLEKQKHSRRPYHVAEFLVQDKGSTAETRSTLPTGAHLALLDIRYPEWSGFL